MNKSHRFIKKSGSGDGSSGINIGSASIIMVFVVLCMTIFSVLSLMTAVNEFDTAEKYASSVAAYYEADCNGDEITKEPWTPDDEIIVWDGEVT
ncbi:MAG: hypothetical protein IKV96_02485 [Firmicutes bacterium]|nr:hypothetical protein [Bacillota bacterium]